MSRSITSQAMTSHQGEDVREWRSVIAVEKTKECSRPASSGEITGKKIFLSNPFISFFRLRYLTTLLTAEIIWRRYRWMNEWIWSIPKKRNSQWKTCTSASLSTTWTDLGSNPGPRGDSLWHGVPIPSMVKDCSSASLRQALGATHPIQWAPGDISSGTKRPGCKDDNSLPLSEGIKNAWRCASTSPYTAMA
jgi:hypothetical protein